MSHKDSSLFLSTSLITLLHWFIFYLLRTAPSFVTVLTFCASRDWPEKFGFPMGDVD